MRKGQGSLEYLLILAAILAIAVVIILVANSMLGTPQDNMIVQEDKYKLSLQGIEVIGYDNPFDPNNAINSAPTLSINGETYAYLEPYSGTGTLTGTLSDSEGSEYSVYIGNEGSGEYYIDTGIVLLDLEIVTTFNGACNEECACPGDLLCTFIATPVGGNPPYVYSWEYLLEGSEEWVTMGDTDNEVDIIFPCGPHILNISATGTDSVGSKEVVVSGWC